MAKSVHCGHDRRVPFDQVRHGVAERERCELHLPELVDEDRVGWNPKRWKREPLKFSDGDSVPSDPRRSRKLLVGKRTPLAAERLDREPHPPAALADLLGDEPSKRGVPLPEQLGEALQGRRLARARARFDQREHVFTFMNRYSSSRRSRSTSWNPSR